jgi:hypothetical protein
LGAGGLRIALQQAMHSINRLLFYCASAGDAPDSAGRPTSEGPGAAPATHELAFRTRAIFKFVFIWFVSLLRIHLLFVFYSIGFL